MATAHCSHSDLEGEQKDMESVRFGGQRSMSKFKAVTRELQRKQLWLVKRGAPLTRNWGNSNCAQRSRPPPSRLCYKFIWRKRGQTECHRERSLLRRTSYKKGFPKVGTQRPRGWALRGRLHPQHPAKLRDIINVVLVLRQVRKARGNNRDVGKKGTPHASLVVTSQ